jgi:hypothetical protein
MILSQNIDIKKLAEEGMFKGENYRYIVLKSSFIPKKSGKLTIEPLSMDVDVQLPTNRRDVFGRVVIVDDVKEFLQVLKQLKKHFLSQESHLISQVQ